MDGLCVSRKLPCVLCKQRLPALLPLPRSRLQAELLTLVLLSPGREWTLTEVHGDEHECLERQAESAGVELVARTPLILTALTVFGALYLVWLGLDTLAHPSTPHARAQQGAGSWVKQAAEGLGISGLNPKVFLLFLALLPTFTDPAARWPLEVQILALGLGSRG